MQIWNSIISNTRINEKKLPYMFRIFHLNVWRNLTVEHIVRLKAVPPLWRRTPLPFILENCNTDNLEVSLKFIKPSTMKANPNRPPSPTCKMLPIMPNKKILQGLLMNCYKLQQKFHIHFQKIINPKYPSPTSWIDKFWLGFLNSIKT